MYASVHAGIKCAIKFQMPADAECVHVCSSLANMLSVCEEIKFAYGCQVQTILLSTRASVQCANVLWISVLVSIVCEF